MNPWEATHPTSIDQAERKLQQFPELLPLHIELLGTGFDHTVYAINHQYAFRFPRRQMGLEAMRTETAILSQLSTYNLSFPVPAPRFLGQATDNDYPFVGFNLLEGNVLTDQQQTDLNTKEARRLALFLKELHQLKVTAPPDYLDRLSVKKRKPRLKETLLKVQPILPQTLFKIIDTFLKQVSAYENPKGESFVHGDLHPKNVLIQNSRISGIIDWGDAHIGHPAMDLSFVYMVLSSEQKREFFDIYGRIDEYTEELARFRALFTSVMLLLYAAETEDVNVKRWAIAGVEKALG